MSRQPEKPLRPPEDDPLFDIQQAASMTECTGLLPAQIASEDEGESIAALEGIHPILPSSLLRNGRIKGNKQ